MNPLDRCIEDAMWAGDVDKLEELAPCGCCCHEHYFLGCPAQAWGGCRGQGDMCGEAAAWLAHYQKFHGMTEEEFNG